MYVLFARLEIGVEWTCVAETFQEKADWEDWFMDSTIVRAPQYS